MIESLAPDLEQAHARAGAMALSLIGILGQAFELQGRAVQPSFCIGVAGFQGLERSVDEMRQCVELALGEAQRPGTQSGACSTRSCSARARTCGVGGGYPHGPEQPFHCITSRWWMPRAGCRGRKPWCAGSTRARTDSARAFIPAAEQMGLIFALDRWVLRLACQQLALWAQDAATGRLDPGGEPERPGVPPCRLCARMQDILRDTGAPTG
jgi:hypothetical protein